MLLHLLEQPLVMSLIGLKYCILSSEKRTEWNIVNSLGLILFLVPF